MLTAKIIWSELKLKTFDEVVQNYKSSDVWIVDRNDYPMESIRTKNEYRSLDWVKLPDVSPAFRDLLIQVEDHRFYSHFGVDLLAMGNAVIQRISSNSTRGASTLTMQLVELLKEKNKSYKRKSIFQKVNQVLAAIKLDFTWSKEQILEAYINLVSFRGELVGLRASSLGYFNKNPSGLIQNEAALLVALLRSPNAATDLVAKRACRALKQIQCTEIQNLANQVLAKPYEIARTRSIVPVLSKYFVENQNSESVIKTSLSHKIQELTLKTLQEQLRLLKYQNVNDGAALVLETLTGRVVAYVANAGNDFSSANQVDGIQMRRQAGSTIKPFVYATAFDWNLIHPTSLIDDSAADISVSHGRVYRPRNYDHIFRGLVSVGDALGSSMNVPAVRALQLVGEIRVLDRLRALGFTKLQQDDYYGPSLALGAVDLSLWELAHGYRQFAINNFIFSESTRHSIFNILASPEHRRFTFGMDSVLTLPFAAAVKTGTSKDMRDNWCIGWTSEYTVVVWVGNFNGDPMWNVSGVSGAAPVWRSLMLTLHPNPPQDHITRYEEPVQPLPKQTISRIKYPVPDMLIGIDPDIPKKSQKLPIEIENPQKGQKLYLNNHILSSNPTETTLWTLTRGKHSVKLVNEKGTEIDSVLIEVR